MKHWSCFPTAVKNQSSNHRDLLNLRALRPRLKIHKIALGSDLRAKHATKIQLNFQGPLLAPFFEGINPKCRLRQEKQKELMKQHVWDVFILPGHLKLFESNRVVYIKRGSKYQGCNFYSNTRCCYLIHSFVIAPASEASVVITEIHTREKVSPKI